VAPGRVVEAFDPLEHYWSQLALVCQPRRSGTPIIQYAKALPAFHINAVDAEYTSMDFTGSTGTQSVKEGAEIIVRMT
jgi:hypothetical protein